MHLMLALFWIIVGAMLFLLVEKDNPRGGSIPYPISSAAGVLAVFNLVRWMLTRMARSGGQGGNRSDWKRPPTRRAGDNVVQPDPAFNFSDQPAPVSEPPQPAPEPGTNGAPEAGEGRA